MSNTDRILALLKTKDEANIMIANELFKIEKTPLFKIAQLKHEAEVPVDIEEAELCGWIGGVKSDELKKCIKCGGLEFKTKALDFIAGRVCEEEIICKTCSHSTYWGFGALDYNNIT